MNRSVVARILLAMLPVSCGEPRKHRAAKSGGAFARSYDEIAHLSMDKDFRRLRGEDH